MEDWVGLAARGGREIWWYDLGGMTSTGKRTWVARMVAQLVYPLCYSCHYGLPTMVYPLCYIMQYTDLQFQFRSCFSAVSYIFKCLVFQTKNLVFWSKSLLKSKPLKYTSFFLISNARLKLAKNQPDAKQHPEAELLLLQNYSHSLFPLSFQKKKTKNKKQKKNDIF